MPAASKCILAGQAINGGQSCSGIYPGCINRFFPDSLRNQPCAEGYARFCAGKSNQGAEIWLELARNGEETVFLKNKNQVGSGLCVPAQRPSGAGRYFLVLMNKAGLMRVSKRTLWRYLSEGRLSQQPKDEEGRAMVLIEEIAGQLCVELTPFASQPG